MIRRIFFPLILPLLIALISSCGAGSKDANPDQDSLLSPLETLNKLIEENPEADSLYQQRAEYYLSVNQPEKALTDIRTAIQKNPEKTDYQLTMADIYLSMQNIESCRKTLLKAFDMDPGNPEPSLKLAELNLFLEDYEKVYLYCNKALEIDKFSAKASFIKGFALLEQKDTTKAIVHLQQATQNDAEYYDAYILLGYIFDARHDPIAGNYLKTAVRLRPESVEARYLYGLWLQNQGLAEDALVQYDALLTVEPENAAAWNNIGYINLVYLKNYRTAVDKFSKAIELKRDFTEAYVNRGVAYEELGMFEKARSDFKQALKINDNYEKAIEGLNRIEGK